MRRTSVRRADSLARAWMEVKEFRPNQNGGGWDFFSKAWARETQSSSVWDSSIFGARTSRECTRSEEKGSERKDPIPWAIARPTRNQSCCPSAGSPEGEDRLQHRTDLPVFSRSSGGEPKHSRNRMPWRAASVVRRGSDSNVRA